MIELPFKLSDRTKIERIFEYTKTWITTQKGRIQKPKFQYKNVIEDVGMEYVFKLPLGMPYKKLEYLNENIGVFEDGLHKNVELDFKNGKLHIYVYDNNLPKEWKFNV